MSQDFSVLLHTPTDGTDGDCTASLKNPRGIEPRRILPQPRGSQAHTCMSPQSSDCLTFIHNLKPSDPSIFFRTPQYFPDVPDLLIWARYCKHIGFPDSFTQRIIAQQSVPFQGSLYSPEHSQRFSTEHSEAKLERDPDKKHCFILKIDGVSVFQWFRDMARKLIERMGFRQPEPKQRGGIRR